MMNSRYQRSYTLEKEKVQSTVPIGSDMQHPSVAASGLEGAQ